MGERAAFQAIAATLLLVVCPVGPVASGAAADRTGAADSVLIVPVFRGASLFFSPDSAGKFAQPGTTPEDRGRAVAAEVTLPDFAGPHRIHALVSIRPVPQDERTVYDRWDRAGNLRLSIADGPDLEVVRFITSYGGRTDFEVDVSELGPLLRGRKVLRAFIDTWTSPAWTADVSLRYVADSTWDAPVWAAPVFYTDSFQRKGMPEGVDLPVEIPPGLARVVLRVFSTGHCTDGRDADEFISKANVITIDGIGAARFHPWRTDCRNFRDRNPYCSRWTDGSWSSDYSRSGWCPGTEVVPLEFDLTDRLPAGKHTVHYAIEDMRPEDAAGNHGYWRVSAALVGWDHPPELWKN